MERHRRGSFAEKKNKDQVDDFCAVNVLSLAEELKEQLATGNSLANVAGGSITCLIIIPEIKRLIRNVNLEMYNPHHVAVGPYHLTKNPDLAMYAEKIRSLEALLSAASGGTPLEVYVEELERLEGHARSCYAHSFDNITSREFVRTRKSRARRCRASQCYFLSMAHHSGTPLVSASRSVEAVAVARDVFYLAENQIPFFVLDKIHQLTNSGGSVSAVETTMAVLVRHLLRAERYSIAAPQASQPGNLLHLVHMHLMSNFVPSATGYETIGKKVGLWRSAIEYYFTGVKFRKRPLDPDGAHCILDVKLDSSGPTLEVPTLDINAGTLVLLRNLIALEQRNHNMLGSHVTAYCIFLSHVACTASDVMPLSRIGILDGYDLSNPGEIARSFAELCTGIMFDPDDLRGTWQVLEKGYRSSLRRWKAWLWRNYLFWMAWLMQKYFTNPWAAIGLIAGTIGLACTVLQAVYSVMSYKQQGAN
ncbi:unnamed protein product [Urochloa decumbens]|uniref:Uncharacterized protein n=1 Tax=Urochloa decumbens TaxID=240449 RepID=A0ABC9BZD6_9POAL